MIIARDVVSGIVHIDMKCQVCCKINDIPRRHEHICNICRIKGTHSLCIVENFSAVGNIIKAQINIDICQGYNALVSHSHYKCYYDIPN